VSYVSGNGMYIPAPSNNQLYLQVTTGTFIQLSSPDLKVDYYTAEIVKSTEYSCYGVELNEWGYVNIDSYRYGFNGKELDIDDMGGGGSTYDYGFRIYNPALGKFLSVDPLTQSYPWYTPYQFAGNKPILCLDIDGLEEIKYSDPDLEKKLQFILNSSELINSYIKDFFAKYPDAMVYVVFSDLPEAEISEERMDITSGRSFNLTYLYNNFYLKYLPKVDESKANIEKWQGFVYLDPDFWNKQIQKEKKKLAEYEENVNYALEAFDVMGLTVDKVKELTNDGKKTVLGIAINDTYKNNRAKIASTFCHEFVAHLDGWASIESVSVSARKDHMSHYGLSNEDKDAPEYKKLYLEIAGGLSPDPHLAKPGSPARLIADEIDRILKLNG
jgi:RHS repeat-associated protein